jgi:hypothetical protein
MKKGKIPFKDYSFIKHHIWEEFIKKMSSEEANAKGENSPSSQRETHSTTT